MSKPVKGLRIGKYRITPLGLITLAILLLIIIGVVVMVVFNPFGGMDSPFVKETPTPTVDPASVTPTPSPSPSPSPTPEPEPKSARIRSLGEIAMQLNLLKSVANGNDFDFSEMFSYVNEIMGNADYTVADVEGTLGGIAGVKGNLSEMITPPSLIDTLKECGVDMLTLANDHALDGGAEELKATLQNLRDADMAYIGAAASAEEKKTPVIVEINGINVAFLAYTEDLGGKEKEASKSLLNAVNLVTKSNASADVKAAREAGADVIVCYVSWGKMLKRDITANQKTIMKVLVKAGVDVIIGYGPHCVQPAAWVDGPKDAEGNVHRTLILCSTGNFLSDQRDQYFDSGIIFDFTIQETGPATGKYTITAPTYIPTYVWRAQGEGDNYTYHTLAVGQWREDQPENMAYTDVTRMRGVWSEIQNIMGTDVATISAE